ncbi:hypothetical protein [Streptomyces vinaceus]|uniref:hypothetical protein n=1 Tax=Streptomyces vinaceus TaxID=1960 RepID=UPI00369CF83D
MNDSEIQAITLGTKAARVKIENINITNKTDIEVSVDAQPSNGGVIIGENPKKLPGGEARSLTLAFKEGNPSTGSVINLRSSNSNCSFNLTEQEGQSSLNEKDTSLEYKGDALPSKHQTQGDVTVSQHSIAVNRKIKMAKIKNYFFLPQQISGGISNGRPWDGNCYLWHCWPVEGSKKIEKRIATAKFVEGYHPTETIQLAHDTLYYNPGENFNIFSLAPNEELRLDIEAVPEWAGRAEIPNALHAELSFQRKGDSETIVLKCKPTDDWNTTLRGYFVFDTRQTGYPLQCFDNIIGGDPGTKTRAEFDVSLSGISGVSIAYVPASVNQWFSGAGNWDEKRQGYLIEIARMMHGIRPSSE